MNALVEKTFNGTAKVRIVTVDGQPWFVAADVVDAFGIERQAGTSYLLRHLDDDQKMMLPRSNVTLGAGSSFPNRGAMVVNESGLYKMILRSDRPNAKAFQDWVTRDVLPAIRKDGGYIMGEETVQSDDELMVLGMQAMARKIERLKAENQIMSDELNLVTVDEYRSLKHAYWPIWYSARVGKIATRLCKEQKVAITQQERPVRTYAGPRVQYVNVYPRHMLDAAVKQVGPAPLRSF